MIAMTLTEIAAVVGGVVHDDTVAGVRVVAPAAVDSRAVAPGGLFVAVPGERVDGHDFATAAVEGGAAAVLAQRPVGVPAVVVPDVVGGLGLLAHHVVGRLPQVRVVGLTGSQGKTSTKDLLAQVLAPAGVTVATHGNLNNEIGMPLTALRADEQTRFLVLEMGARHVGNIAALCDVVPPDIGLVLNVGKAHLGEFGSQDAIARTKGELVESLTSSGTAVLNADDPLVAAMGSRTRAAVLTYGESASADVRVAGLTLGDTGCPAFDLVTSGGTAPVRLGVLGEHQAGNAAAAAAAALALGLDLGAIADRLSAATNASRWRMELHERPDGVLVVNDAYNANPDSMRAALKPLADLGHRGGHRGGRRTIAVLGEMRELGASSGEEHDRVGRLAVRLDIGQLLVVGEAARPLHLGACLEGSWGGESVFVADNDEALSWLRGHLAPGDVVLLKASRAAALETVAEALLGDTPENPTTKETDR